MDKRICCTPENESLFDGYKLVFEDNFDYEGSPDRNLWTMEVGNRWANNEAQAYTDRLENVKVENGALIITARAEEYNERQYTSARINTFGHRSFKYGYFEAEACLPKATGTWPAIWFLPESIRQGERWPLCGEIDLVEHVHRHKDDLFYSLHAQNHNHANPNTVQYTRTFHCDGVCENFHKYGMLWTEEYIEYFLDGKSVCRYNKSDDEDTSNESWPFDKEYFMILNVAVGGGFGGPVTDEELPSSMTVNYVRAWQKITK
ncbi:MAG: glycoside hydrolase family 16 protein [Lachnospiraceae bacterium]|nr:glycoside hydrolase family 16 protein [Lachnospiraceae bacterium]